MCKRGDLRMITDPILIDLVNNYDKIGANSRKVQNKSNGLGADKAPGSLPGVASGWAVGAAIAGSLPGLICIPFSTLKSKADILAEQRKEKRQKFMRLYDFYLESKSLNDYRLSQRAMLNPSTITRLNQMRKVDHVPDKVTIYCICLALELNLDEIIELINLSGNIYDEENPPEYIISYYIVKLTESNTLHFEGDEETVRTNINKRIFEVDEAIEVITKKYYLCSPSTRNKRTKE